MQRFHCFFILVLLIFLTGCGSGGKVSLKGKVTFADDGSPVSAGTVALVGANGKMSRGDIKEDGTYVVGTEKATDGLPPGSYQVFISSALKTIPIDAEKGQFNYEQLIAKKYEDPKTSGLTIEVNDSTKTYDIRVERFKK